LKQKRDFFTKTEKYSTSKKLLTFSPILQFSKKRLTLRNVTKENFMLKYTLNNGTSNPGIAGFKGNTNQKLPVVNWLADLPETQLESDLVEVQFKNTRKGYFLNCNKLMLEKGEKVCVEAMPGHDLGEVTLTGRLVLLQIKKNRVNMERYSVKRIYRRARQIDLEKYEESKAKEHNTMIRARKIAEDLKLDMKIGDVEYQADGNKAIFYYISDGRVDFGELIRVLAETFKVRIEMKQIGARQEAGRIGGIGPCGRELCCATWLNNFVSVSTNAARTQDVSTNPLKLAGQCAKIKCCVNYEMPIYVEAINDFPSKDTVLHALDGDYYHVKTDVFKRTMSYASAGNSSSNLTTLPVERVHQIIKINREGKKATALIENIKPENREKTADYKNVVGQDSLTRFDRNKNKNNHFKR
jgi:cell fate regulator YaaT (PSP1 superfamily)